MTSVDMGSELPVVRSAGKPFLDNQGLWIEAEVVYAGGFTVSLETYVSPRLLPFTFYLEGVRVYQLRHFF